MASSDLDHGRHLYFQPKDCYSRLEKTLQTNLTNPMRQSRSWESRSSSNSREIARISWNPNVHYRVHNSASLVAIVSQINPICTFPSCFLKSQFSFSRPYIFRSTKTPLSSWFPQNKKCVQLILFILSPELYLATSSSYEAFNFAVF